jgi:hypothetical protein
VDVVSSVTFDIATALTRGSSEVCPIEVASSSGSSTFASSPSCAVASSAASSVVDVASAVASTLSALVLDVFSFLAFCFFSCSN